MCVCVCVCVCGEFAYCPKSYDKIDPSFQVNVTCRGLT